MQAKVARKRWMPLLVVVQRSEREERGQREERGEKRGRSVISCTVRRVVIIIIIHSWQQDGKKRTPRGLHHVC